MRLLRKQAKKTEQRLLEENTDNYEAMVKANYSAKTSKAKPIAFFGTIGAAVLTLTLCLVFLLPTKSPPEKHYYEANEVMVNSTVEEVNASLDPVQVAMLPQYSYIFKRCYDSEYNDTLFFTIEIKNDLTFESATVWLYINKDFDRRKTVSNEAVTEQIGSFTISYDNHYIEDGGLYTLFYKAQSKWDGFSIYIDYTQLALENSSNFFKLFTQTFLVK